MMAADLFVVPSVEKDAPISGQAISSGGRIVVTPHVGGLLHRYDRAAA